MTPCKIKRFPEANEKYALPRTISEAIFLECVLIFFLKNLFVQTQMIFFNMIRETELKFFTVVTSRKVYISKHRLQFA